jgi:hypothetical protein
MSEGDRGNEQKDSYCGSFGFDNAFGARIALFGTDSA